MVMLPIHPLIILTQMTRSVCKMCLKANPPKPRRNPPQPTLKPLPPEKSAPAVQFQGPLAGEGNFRALQETIIVILKGSGITQSEPPQFRSFFPPTSLMFLIMDPFFKHYTPQLAHNCCPCCIMNYASCNANPGSLALDKSQAVEEAGVITKTIPGDPEKTSVIWSTGVLPRLPHVRSRLTPLGLALMNSCWALSRLCVPSNVLTHTTCLNIAILHNPGKYRTTILFITH